MSRNERFGTRWNEKKRQIEKQGGFREERSKKCEKNSIKKLEYMARSNTLTRQFAQLRIQLSRGEICAANFKPLQKVPF